MKGAPITWLFEPESFAPIAKLVDDEQYSIVTDYLGTPVLMTNARGRAVWSASVSAYGELRDLEGEREACPFRWPGQYEDAETGLYYNRFRYYDPEAGGYVCQDPIGLGGGLRLYAYGSDVNRDTDPFGLAKTGGCGGKASGGAKRGPKTDPNAPHNAKIRSEADALEAKGNTIIAGGGRGKERLIRTPGGKKSGRRPDILYETPDGQLRGRNVGRTKADGTPVPREVDALDDLNGPGGLPTDFVGYD